MTKVQTDTQLARTRNGAECVSECEEERGRERVVSVVLLPLSERFIQIVFPETELPVILVTSHHPTACPTFVLLSHFRCITYHSETGRGMGRFLVDVGSCTGGPLTRDGEISLTCLLFLAGTL